MSSTIISERKKLFEDYNIKETEEKEIKISDTSFNSKTMSVDNELLYIKSEKSNNDKKINKIVKELNGSSRKSKKSIKLKLIKHK